MRVRVATTALGITAALLAVPACSTDTTPDPTTTSTGTPARADGNDAPLSSAALKKRLLDEDDLGSGYLRTPQRPTRHDDVTVVGCPTLSELGGDAATGGSLTFPRKAKVTFAYGGSSSEVSEELYSDTPGKLSAGTDRIFDAMTSCPNYQVLAGSTLIDMHVQETTAPPIGDEQWSQLLTYSTGGNRTVVKQTAIRTGTILVIVSGAPALVDAHLTVAVSTATGR